VQDLIAEVEKAIATLRFQAAQEADKAAKP